MKILVLNCGSSSVKYQLIETDLEMIEQNADRALARGAVERIGTSSAIHTYQPEGKEKRRDVSEILEHSAAISEILHTLTQGDRRVLDDVTEVDAVGHRTVHGGEAFAASVLITPEVLETMEECSELAPLHNPHNLRGYRAAKRVLPDVPHVAVFDTAYHQSMPPRAWIYGLPYVLYARYQVRRYGFHGTSHRYVSWRLQALMGRKREEMRIITCHLGNGSSLCAIDHGRSVDTSMGFTPLEGLIMGTRCGDLDPGIMPYVVHKEELTHHQASTMLNKHSGLYGISGVSNDMKEICEAEAEGHERAHLAVEAFCYRVRKYIAAYAAAMGGVDAVVFTAGIGENAPEIRARCCEGLDFMGIEVDPSRNDGLRAEGEISPEGAKVGVWVIPTNEELIIARDTVRVMKGVIRPPA